MVEVSLCISDNNLLNTGGIEEENQLSFKEIHAVCLLPDKIFVTDNSLTVHQKTRGL